MDKVTISDYIKGLTEEQKAFYGDIMQTNIPDEIKDDDFQSLLTMLMLQCYGGYRLRESVIEMGVADAANVVYNTYAYKYRGLIKTIELEFDPIENYNMTETSTDTHSGKDTTTDNFGARTTEQTYGQAKSTTQGSVSPYNATSYNPSDQSVTTADPRTDTATAQPAEDTSTMQYGHTVKHELTRKGNIGVTTSTQMAEAYRDYVNFSLARVVAEDLMVQLCNRYLF